jgi:membrane protein required for beta-lactamase induction
MNSLARILLALIPAIALTFAVPLVNRVEPRIFGLPFLLVWILLWVAATPLFLLGIERLRRQA